MSRGPLTNKQRRLLRDMGFNTTKIERQVKRSRDNRKGKKR
jgi:hypothetical protein